MSNTEDNKKKGFFSRLFGVFGASKEPEQVSSDEDIIITPSEDPKVNTESISKTCLLYTSPSPRDGLLSRMPSSA